MRVAGGVRPCPASLSIPTGRTSRVRKRLSDTRLQPAHERRGQKWTRIIKMTPPHGASQIFNSPHRVLTFLAMDHILASSRRSRTNENFTRAASRLMRRCHQISRRYNAQVYVQLSRQHKYYDYTSTNDVSFPVGIEALVRSSDCIASFSRS
jgi:hypothetical protein